MAYSDADMQVKTGSAAFAQCQANFLALTAEALTIAAVKTFSSSPVVPTPTTDMQASTKKYVDDVLGRIYPIGIVVTLGVSTNPAALFGIGTWTAITGKAIVGIDGTTEFATLDQIGGAKTHTLITAEMPAHTHPQDATTLLYPGSSFTATGASQGVAQGGTTGSTGGGGAHNNLSPYIVKYVWQRTA